jgi:hypothetical protein
MDRGIPPPTETVRHRTRHGLSDERRVLIRGRERPLTAPTTT